MCPVVPGSYRPPPRQVKSRASLRGRGHFFGEATGRIFSGVLTPYFLEPYTHSPTVFFGTIMVVVAIGACVPLLLGRETIGQLELVSEGAEEPAVA